MLDSVQQASFFIVFFSENSNLYNTGIQPQSTIIWVCLSFPVAILPTVRRAGVWITGCALASKCTRRGHTPESKTACMCSSLPSETYESAQQASVKTSLSVWSSNLARYGIAGFTSSNTGFGLPRHKLEIVHVALRITLSFSEFTSKNNKGLSAPSPKTKSRHSGESPAMLPSAQIACSRTSSLGASRRAINFGTAPLSVATLVCWRFPEATFVIAHAASNCNSGASNLPKNSINTGTTPVFTISSIGGSTSSDSKRRKCFVHIS